MFTYTGWNDTALDRARFALGDTNGRAVRRADGSMGPLLEDEAITTMLVLYPEGEAVAKLAEGLASRYAQMPDHVTLDDGTSVSWRERVSNWTKLAATSRSESRALAAQATMGVARVRRAGYAAEPEYAAGDRV